MKNKAKKTDYETIKKRKADKIRAHNLLEEANEILENCIKCGMCKSLCPVFKVLREEKLSPRGHSILLQERLLDESMYKCTLCRACEKRCPLNLKVCDAVLKAREAMVLKNRGLKTNKKMVKAIEETGSPFKKGASKDDDKLYCC